MVMVVVGGGDISVFVGKKSGDWTYEYYHCKPGSDLHNLEFRIDTPASDPEREGRTLLPTVSPCEGQCHG